MDTTVPIVLASQSPRRRELLAAAGIPFDVLVADVDESVHDDESPEDYVRRVARAKADAVSILRPDAMVLGADTTVVLDAHILGKPTDDADATRMLQALAGRTHRVLTAVAAVGPTGEDEILVETRVTFRQMSAEEIAHYVASGEPRDKAGAYGIQGRAARFIPHIDGEYANVVGLPVSAVDALLRRLRVIS